MIMTSSQFFEFDFFRLQLRAGIHGPQGPRTSWSSSVRHTENNIDPRPVWSDFSKIVLKIFLADQLYGPWIPALRSDLTKIKIELIFACSRKWNAMSKEFILIEF